MALVTPTIFADAILERLGQNMKLRGLAVDVTEMVAEITEAGTSVKFPSLKRTAVAGSITKGTPIEVSDLDMTDATAVIDHVGTGKRIYDKDVKQVKAKVLAATAVELADAMNTKMEKDLAAAILADAVYFSPAENGSSLTDTEKQQALSLFGDQLESEKITIVINSRLRQAFVTDEKFTASDTTYRKLGNGIVVNGYIGDYYGSPVHMADVATWDSVANECITFLIREDALGYVLQKDLTIEEQRPSLLFATDLLVDSLYACKLLDPKGVVVIRKTAPSTLIELALTSLAGSSSGKTKVTVNIALPVGHSAVYKTGSALELPDYDDVLTTGWTAFAAGADITATTDNDIIVAYIKTADNKAKYAGKTTVVSAE